MIDFSDAGAFASTTPQGFQIAFGLLLPGITAKDGFEVVVRIIHRDDRFNPAVPARKFSLTWQQNDSRGLWKATVAVQPDGRTNLGKEGVHLYRFQLLLTDHAGTQHIVTNWFTDPFARRTEEGLMSAIELRRNPTAFVWTDANHKTPELDDLIVYELQIAQFNDTFDGVVERLDYLKSLGVNCLELMPVNSAKTDFDWGYGPLHYFSPSTHYGGPDGLRRLVNSCHAAGVAVILDVVYQHVDPFFTYHQVYDDLKKIPDAPHPASPMIGADGQFGPQADFNQEFTRDFFVAANQNWLDNYHVDGFRYDQVTDLYTSPTDNAYAALAFRTYNYSVNKPRFTQDPNSYSRIIQCAEALGKAKPVLATTYTNCAWQDDLLNKAVAIAAGALVTDDFAHTLDPLFQGYPDTNTVTNADGQPVKMPVAPFQYLNSHDHSHLIVAAGLEHPKDLLSPGDRTKFWKLQPMVVALLTCQGVPMLWQGEEFVESYNLPGGGQARIGLRRDAHWEYFYDDNGTPMVRLYRRLGQLRRSTPALRGRRSFYYFEQSLKGNQILAYHRHDPASDSWAMVVLNFGHTEGTIQLPFPKAGIWTEMLDADTSPMPPIQIASDQATATVNVPPNYGYVFVRG